MAEFGYDEDALDEVADVKVAAEHALDMRAQAGARITSVETTRARLRERAALLGEFAQEDGLEDVERQPRVRRLSAAWLDIASTEAEISALEQSSTLLDRESALLGDWLTELEERTGEDAQEQKAQEDAQKELVAQEVEAKRKADEARRREEATKDATLKQLYARERELRDALVKLATERRELGEIQSRSNQLADEFSATKGEILGRVDELSAEPAEDEKQTKVDPLLRDILRERRDLWAQLADAREIRTTAEERVEKLTDSLAAAQKKLAAEKARERELGGGALWKQRVKVAETEVELNEAQLDAAAEQRENIVEQVELLERGVEFFSTQLRAIIDRASSDGRSEVYGILNDDALSDAYHRLNDRYHGARRLMSTRLEAGRSLGDRLLELGTWLLGLVGWLFMALLIMWGLRFVPGVTRGILDFLQGRKFFKRRPSLAIKIFEVLRVIARPILLYISAILLLGYVIETFGELRFLRWGVDAFFVYLVGVRAAAAIALPRWYREREGMASAGTETDLRPDEAAIADILRLDIEKAKKFVRSARIVFAVGTVWYFAPSIAIAITGVSVLSGLITTLTRIAILVVIYWMLSTWRDELSNLFSRLAGNRLPKASAFVEKYKDNRLIGVLVVAVVSVVVISWEAITFARRVVRNTDWFKRASAYAFKTKIELQQRDEPTDEEVSAYLPDDLEEAFGPRSVLGTAMLVERASMKAVKEKFDSFLERGFGTMCIVGAPGIGKTTMRQWLLHGHAHVELQVDDRICFEQDVLDVFRESLDSDVQTVDELVEVLTSEPPSVFVLDGLERCFVRDIGGFGAYKALTELIHRLSKKHVWLIVSNQHGWEYLTRVYDQRHVFNATIEVPRWSDEELRELVESRMAGLSYATSFSALADLESDYAEVVKTARGYYRYLAEFTRGIPATAMHYWLRSLTTTSPEVFNVGLFSRPSGAALVAAPPNYRFFLAAIAQHGCLTPREAARIDNTPIGTCELAAAYFAECGAIRQTSDGFVLAAPFLSLTLRHLEDSNLL